MPSLSMTFSAHWMCLDSEASVRVGLEAARRRSVPVVGTSNGKGDWEEVSVIVWVVDAEAVAVWG